MIWLVMIFVSFVVFVSGIVRLIKKGNLDYAGNVMEAIGGMGMWLLFLFAFVMFASVEREIEAFVEFQQTLERYENDIKDTPFEGVVFDSLSPQIAEMNEWLEDARASEKTFGIFSFYRGKIDDLSPIVREGVN
jgi:hypothetical protein